jgi:hypothetical protein
MRRERITHAFTFDHHFVTAGFQALTELVSETAGHGDPHPAVQKSQD